MGILLLWLELWKANSRATSSCVSREAGGGWAVGFSPSRPHSVITLVIYNVQKTNAVSAETSPQPMP